jgi:hypothetical protein
MRTLVQVSRTGEALEILVSLCSRQAHSTPLLVKDKNASVKTGSWSFSTQVSDKLQQFVARNDNLMKLIG